MTYQYNLGIQREIGFQTVMDIAYVGSNTHHTATGNWNYNLLPSGIRFLPSSRDVTKPSAPRTSQVRARMTMFSSGRS